MQESQSVLVHARQCSVEYPRGCGIATQYGSYLIKAGFVASVLSRG